MPNPLRRNHQAHFVVCGDNPLAQRLVEELTRLDEDVVVILPNRNRNHGPQIAARPGVRVVEAAELTEEAFRAANLTEARALALVNQDDVGNIHAALRATELAPGIRLVVRMFTRSLGYHVQQLFSDCAVLSDSAMAAPWFVAAAFGDESPNHVRLPGRTLYVAQPHEVLPDHVLCGIAVDQESDSLTLLPPGEDSPRLVLAVADGTPRDPLLRHRRGHVLGVLHTLRGAVNRRLALAVLGLAALLVLGTVLFAVSDHISWWNAAYLTLLDVAGAAQPEMDSDRVDKLTQVMVTLVGISLIPVLTAGVVDAVVGARLAAAAGRLRGRVRDHVVVVGLGNVGIRVVGQIHDLGVSVVCVERSEDAPGMSLARRLGVPVVIGDASRAETLRAASVGTSRALIAVTSDDVTNLQAALHARALRQDLRVVLRLFDGDLARRVQRTLGFAMSRSVSYLAAPAFAAAMMERQVIDTIAIDRRVLLIAEVPVSPHSVLDGQRLNHVDALHDARVLAVRRRGTQYPDWAPYPDQVLTSEDRVLVVTTRTGLRRLLTHSTTPRSRDAGEEAS